jgi:hypothetical protein
MVETYVTPCMTGNMSGKAGCGREIEGEMSADFSPSLDGARPSMGNIG